MLAEAYKNPARRGSVEGWQRPSAAGYQDPQNERAARLPPL
jgi:hypothetical protein